MAKYDTISLMLQDLAAHDKCKSTTDIKCNNDVKKRIVHPRKKLQEAQSIGHKLLKKTSENAAIFQSIDALDVTTVPQQPHLVGVGPSKCQSKVHTLEQKYLPELLNKLTLRRSSSLNGVKNYILQLKIIRRTRSTELVEELKHFHASNQCTEDDTNCIIELEIENKIQSDVIYRTVSSQLNWIGLLETNSVLYGSLCNRISPENNNKNELNLLLTLYKEKNEAVGGRSSHNNPEIMSSLHVSFERHIFQNAEAGEKLQKLCGSVLEQCIRSESKTAIKKLNKSIISTKNHIVRLIIREFDVQLGLHETLSMLVECCLHRRIGFACYLPKSLCNRINSKNQEWNAKKEMMYKKRLHLNQLGLDNNVYEIMQKNNNDDSSYFPQSVNLFSSLPCEYPSYILASLLTAIKMVHQEAGKLLGKGSCYLSVDSILPILIDIIVRSNLRNIYSQIHLLQNYCGEKSAEEEYYLTCLISVVAYIKEYQ